MKSMKNVKLLCTFILLSLLTPILSLGILQKDTIANAQRNALSQNPRQPQPIARRISNWTPVPGSAKDVGDGWIIGTNPETHGYGIYRWNGSNWDKVPGSAVRIGGNSHNPWVVNNQGQIYRWNGSNWTPVPGSAKDVGDGWVIGTNPETHGYGIYRWNGSNWTPVPGSAVRIGGNSHNPWVVNNQDQIYRQ